MSQCIIQWNAFVGCEETRGSAFFSDPNEPVACPKPRRVGILSINPMRLSSRLQISSPQSEACESKAVVDLLDLILKKEGYEEEQSTAHVSPPFFCGSPPSRASNPLVQDDRFGDEKLAHFQELPSPSRLLSPSSSARKGGCVKMKFGFKAATVRVEGFDCLNRDCQNSSIPAVA